MRAIASLILCVSALPAVCQEHSPLNPQFDFIYQKVKRAPTDTPASFWRDFTQGDGTLEAQAVLSPEGKIADVKWKVCPERLQKRLFDPCKRLLEAFELSPASINGFPQFSRIHLKIQIDPASEHLLVQIVTTANPTG